MRRRTKESLQWCSKQKFTFKEENSFNDINKRVQRVHSYSKQFNNGAVTGHELHRFSKQQKTKQKIGVRNLFCFQVGMPLETAEHKKQIVYQVEYLKKIEETEKDVWSAFFF